MHADSANEKRQREIAYRDDLIAENAVLDAEIKDRIEKRDANKSIIDGIGARLHLNVPDSITTVRIRTKYTSANGASIATNSDATPSEYGALRKAVRDACGPLRRFSLDETHERCPQLPRAAVANALYNLAKIGELRVVAKIGNGIRAKPIYEHVS